jgi:hypothetical protein
MGFPFAAYLASLAGTGTKMNARLRSRFDFFGDGGHLSPNGNAHKAYNRANGNTLEFMAFHDETRTFAQ